MMYKRPCYVYIVEGKDEKLYTGITGNIRRRLNEHNGKGKWKNPRAWTFKRMPVFLVHLEKYQDRKDARLREIEIKKMSREEKLKLISSTTKEQILSAI